MRHHRRHSMRWRQLVRQHRRVQTGGGCDCTVGYTDARCENPCPPPTATIPPATSANTAACALATPTSRATAFPPTAARAARRRRDLLRARRLHLLRERRLVQSRWRVRLRRGVHRQHLRRDRPRVDEAKARWILGREQEGGHQRRRRGGGPAVPIIAAGSGFMCFMVRRERKGAPLFMKLDDSPAPPPVPDLEMSAQNALPGPPAPPPKA